MPPVAVGFERWGSRWRRAHRCAQLPALAAPVLSGRVPARPGAEGEGAGAALTDSRGRQQEPELHGQILGAAGDAEREAGRGLWSPRLPQSVTWDLTQWERSASLPPPPSHPACHSARPQSIRWRPETRAPGLDVPLAEVAGAPGPATSWPPQVGIQVCRACLSGRRCLWRVPMNWRWPHVQRPAA